MIYTTISKKSKTIWDSVWIVESSCMANICDKSIYFCYSFYCINIKPCIYSWCLDLKAHVLRWMFEWTIWASSSSLADSFTLLSCLLDLVMMPLFSPQLLVVVFYAFKGSMVAYHGATWMQKGILEGQIMILDCTASIGCPGMQLDDLDLLKLGPLVLTIHCQVSLTAVILFLLPSVSSLINLIDWPVVIFLKCRSKYGLKI